MCKEHITNSADNLRPLLWHSLMSVDVAIGDTEGLLDLGYFTYIYVMAFPLIFEFLLLGKNLDQTRMKW